MSINDEYYQTLEIEKTASQNDIKKAYYGLSKIYHPDKNPGDEKAEEKFKAITEAYSVLSDPEKRRKYDKYGKNGEHIKTPGAFNVFFAGGPFAFNPAFNPAFEAFFSTLNSRPPKRDFTAIKISDFIADIKVSLKDIYCLNTVKKKITRTRICRRCDGTGSSIKKAPTTCPECHGSGMKVVQILQGPIHTIQQQPCEKCKSTGKITDVDNPCLECGSTGLVRIPTILEMKLEAGMKNGSMYRFEKEGDEYPGKIAGDVVFKIIIAEDPFWKCNGYDLIGTVKISLIESLCGYLLKVPLPNGCAIHKVISDVIEPNSTITIKGKGLISSENTSGDVKITFEVVYPTTQQINSIRSLLRTELNKLFKGFK